MVTKKTKEEKKVVQPKFEKPNLQNLNINKFKNNFRPTGKFQSINRSRR